MVSSNTNMIKKWIGDKKKTAEKLDKSLKAAKAKIKKLEGDLKKAVTREKVKPKKKVVKKKAKKKVAKKKKR